MTGAACFAAMTAVLMIRIHRPMRTLRRTWKRSEVAWACLIEWLLVLLILLRCESERGVFRIIIIPVAVVSCYGAGEVVAAGLKESFSIPMAKAGRPSNLLYSQFSTLQVIELALHQAKVRSF
eukprot:scaffold4885_cov78-Skeletonema_dohrnii-CCMP3373.AAC.1